MLALLHPVQALDAPGTFDYSGLPELQAPQAYRIRSHGTTLDISDDGTVTVSSTTVYRYQGVGGSGTIMIPRRRLGDAKSSAATFAISATWDRQPLRLIPVNVSSTVRTMANNLVLYQGDLSSAVPLKAQGTHALRITYRVALGKTGFDQRQRITGYDLRGSAPIELLSLAYRYTGKTVFRLPAPLPDLGWQVGTRGVSLRRENFVPAQQLTSIAFYPGGFDPIG